MRSEKQLENFSGIYIPFWLTNCRADAAISGNGDRVRSWREGDYRVTETQHFRIEREAEIPFRGIPMDGAKKIDDSLMNAIESFSYEKMKSFQMHYLSGFLAQKYDESYDEVFPRIQQRIQQSCISLLRADVKGYTKCQITSTQVNLYEVQHDYALLPVWFLHYAYKGKNYDFAINGQTGKQAGTPPFSWGRAALFSGAVAIVVTLLLALICFFGSAA